MGKLVLVALRIVLATVLAGSLFVQVLVVTVAATDPEEAELAPVRAPIVVVVVLGIVTIQIILACVWRLLTMVRRGTVFSHAAFRYVDVVIGAVAAASLLTLGLGVTLITFVTLGPDSTPIPASAAGPDNDVVPPGVILLICGAAVMVAGVALIVLVLRMLLAQAVARDTEARHLQAELEKVI